MAKKILCRTAFCQNCYDNGHPRLHGDRGSFHLMYGGKRKGYYFKVVENRVHGKHLGFTPHIYINNGWDKSRKKYNVDVFCGTVECQVFVTEAHDDTQELTWVAKDPKKMYLTKQQWEHIKAFVDECYYI